MTIQEPGGESKGALESYRVCLRMGQRRPQFGLSLGPPPWRQRPTSQGHWQGLLAMDRERTDTCPLSREGLWLIFFPRQELYPQVCRGHYWPVAYWNCWSQLWVHRKEPKLTQYQTWSSPGKNWILHLPRVKTSTRIMVFKGTRHKSSTQNSRVFQHFWVLDALTCTLKVICSVLGYPYREKFSNTQYP